MQLVEARIETFNKILLIWDEPVLFADVHVTGNTILEVEAEEDKRFHHITLNEEVSLYEPVHVLWQNQDMIASAGAVVRTEAFDAHYAYDGPLGVEIKDGITTFRLWAPTAMEVSLNLYPDEQPDTLIAQSHPMMRNQQGVWALSLQGDTEGLVYDYRLKFPNGMVHYSYDPYAKGCIVNGRRSVVMPDEILNPKDLVDVPVPDVAMTDTILTQVHIKDMTMDASSGVSPAYRGKYLGMIEAGTVNETGNATGIDYLVNIGNTHVQLMPITDFGSIDERMDGYSWGYDPLNFQIPEGSYATDPFQPDVRVLEAKKMIIGLHQRGLKVVADMVFSHVFDAANHAFHLTVPGYYYRYDEDGYIVNGTFTGNDLATERTMVRRYILDTVRYWLEEYHLDGICFHLMGAMDVETMRQIREVADSINPNIILLGEGWDVDTALPREDRATVDNAAKMPRIAFYNNQLSRLVRGYETQDQLGFIQEKMDEVKSLYHYHLANLPQPHYPSNFTGPDQVIQSIETHRHMTLNDKLMEENPHDSEGTREKRMMLGVSLVFLAQGIVSFEIGQSFLRSKNGNEMGYYAMEDEVIDWNQAYHYPKMQQYFRGLLEFRKQHKVFHQNHYVDYQSNVRLLKADTGILAYEIAAQSMKYTVIFNAHGGEISLPLASGHYRILIENGVIHEKHEHTIDVQDHVAVPGLSAMVLSQEI